ncbi:MAG TPA: twin-arginine translocation signal domain-containing protein, partial [Algoriphagus sp.]|nr:twin-arginine translocation signal domain-containing protein [Algoriphagus sp.]
MKPSRRKFLAQLGALGASTGLGGIALASADHEKEEEVTPASFTLSILQTTDVHCQIHSHDELFWENGKSVFRKTGGYANLKTFL